MQAVGCGSDTVPQRVASRYKAEVVVRIAAAGGGGGAAAAAGAAHALHAAMPAPQRPQGTAGRGGYACCCKQLHQRTAIAVAAAVADGAVDGDGFHHLNLHLCQPLLLKG